VIFSTFSNCKATDYFIICPNYHACWRDTPVLLVLPVSASRMLMPSTCRFFMHNIIFCACAHPLLAGFIDNKQREDARNGPCCCVGKKRNVTFYEQHQCKVWDVLMMLLFCKKSYAPELKLLQELKRSSKGFYFCFTTTSNCSLKILIPSISFVNQPFPTCTYQQYSCPGMPEQW